MRGSESEELLINVRERGEMPINVCESEELSRLDAVRVQWGGEEEEEEEEEIIDKNGCVRVVPSPLSATKGRSPWCGCSKPSSLGQVDRQPCTYWCTWGGRGVGGVI